MGTFETHYELLRARAEHHVCDPTDIVSAVVTKLARWCVRWCTPNRCLSCTCSAIMLFLFGVCSLCFFASSMTACDPERLEQQSVPNAGNILPDHVWLETRWWTWFGCLQQLDVYAADPPSKALGSRIGQFYAARIPLLYFAVSYQDLDGRVWLSARSPGFFERVNWLGLEYMVERCDAPPAGSAVWLLSAGGMALAALCALAAGEPEQEAFSLVKFVRSGRVSVPDANI